MNRSYKAGQRPARRGKAANAGGSATGSPGVCMAIGRIMVMADSGRRVGLPRWLAAALWLLASASLLCAAEPDSSAPVSVRRVFVPADQMDRWPLGGQRYLPLDQAEFERLLAVTPADSPRDGLPTAQLITARYTARLANDQLLGEALLDAAPTSDVPGEISWDNCNLAIVQAHWDGDQGRKATLALTPEGKQFLLVESPDRLQLDWSLAGRRDAVGGLHFAMNLPPCPVNRLVLELPERWTPLTVPAPAQAAEAAQRGIRRWEVDLGGRDRVELCLMPANALGQPESAAHVRQTTVYDFSQQGVEVSSQWSLDIVSEPLYQISLQLDPGLQLIAARCDDQPLSWSSVPLGDKGTRVDLLLAEPLQGSGHQLRMRAIAAVVLEKPWPLPRIRATGLFWQQADATLLIPFPLTLAHFAADGCRQSGTGPLPSPRNGESAEFEFFSSEGRLQLTLQHLQPRLQVTSGTMVDLAPGEMKAQVIVDLRVTDGELFALQAELARPWTISSLESLPAELISDWNVEQAGGRPRLEMLLAKALSPTRPVRLKIGLRRLFSALGKRLTLPELVPLRFAAATERPLLALHPLGPYELRSSRGELGRTDPKKLDARDLELFAERPEWLVSLDDPNAVGTRISLVRAKPGYRARITAEVLAGSESLGESYNVFCVPQATAVDRLLVQFSPGRETDLRWVLGAEPDSALTARRLSTEEQAATGIPVEDEAWEVLLRRARTEGFELRASRSSRLPEAGPCSLIALPEASQQQAIVAVRCQTGGALRIRSRLTPIPPPANLPAYPPLRGIYRYDPARDLVLAPEPPLRLAWDTESASQSWAWSYHLQSRYLADGRGTHWALYRIRQAGGGRIRLSVPPEADPEGLREVWINQQRTTVQWEEGRRTCLAELPLAEKNLTLMLCFTTTGPPLGIAGSLQPPAVAMSLPVLASRWTAWLPPAYEGYDRQQEGPLDWARRCFGPLARWSDQSRWTLPWSDAAPATSSQPATDAFAQSELLLQAMSAAGDALSREGRPPTWGRWLTHRSLRQLPFCLLVDRQELESFGLTPASPLTLPRSETAAARIAALLDQEDLAILVAPDVAVLTTRDSAALRQRDLKGLKEEGLWAVRAPALAEELQQAARSSNDSLIRAEAWRSEIAAPPWVNRVDAGDNAGDQVGWHAYCPAPGLSVVPTLRYAHRTSIQLAGCVLFLAVVALSWWRLQRNPTRLVLCLTMAGLAAWLVPAPYAPLSAGVILGIAFGLIWRVVMGRRPEAASPSRVSVPPRPTSLHSAARAGATIVALASLLANAPARADSAPPTPPGVYDVLVPVDSQKRPSGRLYVPASLYDRLNQTARARQQRPEGFLLRDAVYRGAFVWQASPEQITLGQLSVAFDLEVFRPGPVRIALSQQSSQLVAEQTLLDGRPITLSWDADGKAFSFPVEEPGPCRLHCTLRPPVRTVGGQSLFEVEIPPLPGARLELLAPAGAPRIQVPSALGAVTWESDPARLVAALGPASRLSVAWETSSRRSGPVEAEVEEFFWLRVQPASVVLEAQLEINSAQGQLREVQLTIDPRLRPLPPPENAPIAEIRVEPGQPQTVRLHLARPAGESLQLRVAFLLTGNSGLGRIRLPQIETANARSIKRHLAVSVDPSLSCEILGPERADRLAVPDFLAEWGSMDPAPQAAYRLPADPVLWTIATRPAGLRPQVQQTLCVSLDEQQAELLFEAQVNSATSRAYHYRLTVPPGLRIDNASLTADGAERISRWSQQPDGTLSLFLSGPAEKTQELTIHGWLPIAERGRLALPLMEIQQAQTVASVLRVFRKPTVAVKIGKTTGMTEVKDPVEEGIQMELGRLVKAYTLDTRPPPAATLAITPNRPNVVATQLTRLIREGQHWSAEVRLALEVKQGVLDQIQLEVPGWWKGPYELDPPEPFQVGEGPGGTQVMTIEPLLAWRGRRQLRVRAPLARPDAVPEVPFVRIAPGPAKERYVALPTEDTLAWETQGLKPVQIDSPLAQGLGGPSTTFLAVADSYRAALKSAAKAEPPQVALADFYLAWQADGAYRGVAVFDLDSPAETCELALPSGCRLLQVLLGGVTVWPDAVADGRWRIPAMLPRLPQAIEVLFDGTLATGPGRQRHFEAPRLVGLTVGQALWTVAGPDRLAPPAPNPEISALRADLIRARWLAGLVDRALTTVGAEPEDLLRWNQLLERRLLTVKATAESELVDMALAVGEQTEPLAMLRNELQELDRPLGQLSQWLARSKPRPAPRPELQEPTLVRMWQSTLEPPSRVRRWSLDGDASGLSCPPPTQGVAASFPHVFAWLGLMAVTLWSVRRNTRTEPVGRLPLALVLALAVAWWLWLQPSWLGALFALVAVAGWLRDRRARQQPHFAPAVITVRSRA